jgi:hypothetical protein
MGFSEEEKSMMMEGIKRIFKNGNAFTKHR